VKLSSFWRRSAAVSFAVVLGFSTLTSVQAAGAKVGGVCAKVGAKATVAAKPVVCTKVGSKLVWKASATPAKVAAVADTDTITLGILLPHTGPNASTAKLMTAGAVTAIKEINEAGGVGGHKLDYILYDTLGTPEAGVRAYNDFVAQGGVYGIIGYSSVVSAVGPLASRDNVLLLNGGSPALSNQQMGTHMMATLGGVNVEMGCAATYAAKTWGKKKVSFVYADVAANYQGIQWFGEKFRSLGGTVAASESVVQASTTDFRSVLTRALAGKPDLLYLYTYGSDPAIVTQQARQLGFTGGIMGYSGIPVPAFIDIAGKDSAEGTRATTGYFDPNGKDAPMLQYVKSWKAYQNADVVPATDLSFYHATLYDSVKVFAAALTQVIKDKGDLKNPRVVQDAIYKVGTVSGLVTGDAVYTKGLQIPAKPLGIVEAQGGKWVLTGKTSC